MVRKFKEHSLCSNAHGLDGASHMIKKAQKDDPKGCYFKEDINTWIPTQKYAVVFSMETLYYFQNPEKVINKIYDNVLDKTGLLVIGVDHYLENTDSLNWGKKFNLDITTLSINDWENALKKSGFKNIQYKQVEKKNKWEGTLIISGEK